MARLGSIGVLSKSFFVVYICNNLGFEARKPLFQYIWLPMKYANGEERLKIKTKIKNTSLSLGVSTVIGVFNFEDDSEDPELDS